MSYYRVAGDDLIASDCVTLPDGRTLVPDNHADWTYPLLGWTWCEDEEEALAKVGASESQDVTVVVKNAGGTRLFGFRVSRYGIGVRNLSNQTALIDAEGGTVEVTDYSLAAGATRFVRFDRVFGEPEQG